MANPITTPVPSTANSAAPAGRPGSPGAPSATAEIDGQRQAPAARGKEAPVAAQEPERSVQDLAQATQDISDYIQTVSRSLEISIDDDLGSTVITVMNADTDEVVRQIPSEEVLQIARFLADQQSGPDADAAVAGLLFNDQA